MREGCQGGVEARVARAGAETGNSGVAIGPGRGADRQLGEAKTGREENGKGVRPEPRRATILLYQHLGGRRTPRNAVPPALPSRPLPASMPSSGPASARPSPAPTSTPPPPPEPGVAEGAGGPREVAPSIGPAGPPTPAPRPSSRARPSPGLPGSTPELAGRVWVCGAPRAPWECREVLWGSKRRWECPERTPRGQ